VVSTHRGQVAQVEWGIPEAVTWKGLAVEVAKGKKIEAI
jgi:hypothetical protein